MIGSLAATARLMVEAASEPRQPRVWPPAASLLLPSLVLQLAFPHWLRTRPSPAISTVILDSVFIAWTTQVAAAASWGWWTAASTTSPRAIANDGLVAEKGILNAGLAVVARGLLPFAPGYSTCASPSPMAGG